MSLLQLAPEILIKILLHLDVSDAYAIQSTNHFLNDIYKGSLELQYALECKVAHVRDNPNCPLPIGDRLRILRDREAAWRSLEPASTRTISRVPGIDSNFGGGLPIIQRDNFLSYDSPTIKSLPLRESHEKTFRSLSEMDNLKHICSCIEEHELIACLVLHHLPDNNVQVQIKLIQHSTGMAHPLAAMPTIILCTSPKHLVGSRACTMEVFGENLVFTIHLESKTLLCIYDWMTGTAKCEPIIISLSAGFVVIDEDLILVPHSSSWSFHIYHIPPSSTGGEVKLICQLSLPPLRHPISDTYVSWIQCHSAPNPTWDGKFPEHVPSSVPFIDDSKTVLIWVIFSIWRHRTLRNERCPTLLVVHRHSIIGALPPSHSWSTLRTPDVVDWNAWGPSATHWSSDIPRYVSPRLHNIVHGQRLILPISSNHVNQEGGSLPGAALIKDFNKYRAHHFQTEKEYKDFEHSTIAPPIKNALPFFDSYLPIQHECREYSISDGLIIGLNRTERLPDEPSRHSLDIMYFGH